MLFIVIAKCAISYCLIYAAVPQMTNTQPLNKLKQLVSQASCERKTENVCTVCDVMEMCVSTTAVLL